MLPQEEATSGEQLSKENPELYERYLLAALNYDEKLWIRMSKHLCLEKGDYGEYDVNDFSTQEHYALYLALKAYRKKIAEANAPISPATKAGLTTALLMLSLQPRPVVISNQIDSLLQTWESIMSATTRDDAVATVKSSWRNWIMTQRAARAVKDIYRTEGEIAYTRIGKLSDLRTELSESDAETQIMDFGDLLEYQDVIVERIPLMPNPWAPLNDALGGGFGKTEHTLIVSPSGGGKTTIACQLAAEMAYTGRYVMIISTEQAPRALMLRILSCMSFLDRSGGRIPFGLIKDGGNLKKLLSDAQQNTFTHINEKLAGHLLIEHWAGQRCTMDDLEMRVQNAAKMFEQKGGKLDAVFLDWIGGALTEHTTDSHVQRMLMIQAADKMKNLAQAMDIATISTAQTTIEGEKKAHITAEHIAECKALHRTATAAFGLSALRNTGSDRESDDSIQDRQYINVFKTRMSKGLYFPIERNMGFQRFDKSNV